MLSSWVNYSWSPSSLTSSSISSSSSSLPYITIITIMCREGGRLNTERSWTHNEGSFTVTGISNILMRKKRKKYDFPLLWIFMFVLRCAGFAVSKSSSCWSMTSFYFSLLCDFFKNIRVGPFWPVIVIKATTFTMHLSIDWRMVVSRPTIWSFIYIWISNPDLREI